MKKEIDLPQLPEYAADWEISETFSTVAYEELHLMFGSRDRVPTWEKWLSLKPSHNEYIVARPPKPRGLKFLATLPYGTVFDYEGKRYICSGLDVYTYTSTWTRHKVAEKRVGLWHWYSEDYLINVCADNCVIYPPPVKEED